ncbi:hypothetical protein [Clostridium sp. DL1XJH146]
MFDVKIFSENIMYQSIDENNIKRVLNWVISNDIGDKSVFRNEKQIQEFIAQYYLSECELMIFVEDKSEIIGFFSGNLEFKNPNELWINFFGFDKKIIGISYEVELIDRFIVLFLKKYDVEKIFIRLRCDDKFYIKYFNERNYYSYNYHKIATIKCKNFIYLHKGIDKNA